MINWLGQEIEIGDHVYKGARAGNTSDYRVGEVIDLRSKPPDTYREQVDTDGNALPVREARVRWIFQLGGIWKRYPWEDRVNRMQVGAVKAHETRPGWNGMDSLVKVDISNIKVVPDGQILQ